MTINRSVVTNDVNKRITPRFSNPVTSSKENAKKKSPFESNDIWEDSDTSFEIPSDTEDFEPAVPRQDTKASIISLVNIKRNYQPFSFTEDLFRFQNDSDDLPDPKLRNVERDKCVKNISVQYVDDSLEEQEKKSKASSNFNSSMFSLRKKENGILPEVKEESSYNFANILDEDSFDLPDTGTDSVAKENSIVSKPIDFDDEQTQIIAPEKVKPTLTSRLNDNDNTQSNNVSVKTEPHIQTPEKTPPTPPRRSSNIIPESDSESPKFKTKKSPPRREWQGPDFKLDLKPLGLDAQLDPWIQSMKNKSAVASMPVGLSRDFKQIEY